ncbi:hypothetical protein MOK15_12155 [Sphingobium sp. BYY-5]|uniref:hypothetical protein n=1 Tax=Sphingobium sp. BYY-5 TaxID=2926400 RepID=UPI001FA725F9|nr:hypothetical protein [Sphingobium sp. BYY-5]MCI4590840.1 hypothetical protein [Sphingobium sp. BYY-5]
MTSAPDPDESEGNVLVAALRAIPASGHGSFENLVRDLLSRETGQRFTLAKSGPQGGVDARSADDGFATVLGVETKRYGLKTRLPADETRSKLDDAATTHPDLELWVLCASREIKEPDASDLRAKGLSLGVEVLILDWPDSAELLPAIALLCAQHEDLLAAYVTVTADIGELLRNARAHVTYAEQCAALHAALRFPTLGYANARAAAADYLREHMASMPAAATRIGRYANLTDPAIIRIDRPELRKAVSTWWDGAMPRQPLALLGAEGMGKTWAALSWWLDRERAGAPLPLTLVVPARFIASTSPDAVIGAALHQMFGVRDPAWWARRARRWCAGQQTTQLILIIDGLNERFDRTDWAMLAAELRLAPWAGAVDLVLTDRTDHWRLLGGGFQATGIACSEVPVAGFSDPELDEILGRAGLDKARLDPALIPLMKVPRLCTLALRHWERLAGSGDMTPERLVYEDFRDRIYPGLDDRDIRNLVAAIGGTVRTAGGGEDTVLRREIGAALGEESGSPGGDATVSAIVSGVWFAPVPGEPHRFRVNPDLAPIAMGLALARAVQTLDTAEAATQRIAAFIDDLRGLQLGVTLTGIAASFATISPDFSPAARSVLLDTWLGSDNFYGDELKRYQRLIAEDPDYFLERTEQVWRDRDRLHGDHNVHLAGIVNAAEAYPPVMTALAARAAIWLSEAWGWRDVVNGGDPPEEIAQAAVAARVGAWNAASQGALPPLILVEPDEDYLCVADTLLSALSYLPRAPFVEALGNYAVVTELTREMHVSIDRFEWLLRANREDPAAAETALIAQARHIRAVADPHADAAADRLLDALASRDPEARPLAQRENRRFGRPSSVTRDAAGLLTWTYAPKDREPGWGEIALRHTTDLLAMATDPAADLAPASIALLEAAAADMIARDQDRSFDMRPELRAVLARWAPGQLLRYLARTTDIDTGRHDLTRILAGLGASWIAHGEDVRIGIDAMFAASLRLPANRDGARDPTMNATLAVLAMTTMSDAEQFAAFRAMPDGPTWPKNQLDLLKPFAPEAFRALEDILAPGTDVVILKRWLALLGHGDIAAMPPGYPPVAALMRHDNAEVRTAAMQVAYRAPDRGLCNALRDSAWRAAGKGSDEAAHGSLALARADIPYDDDPLERIIPLALGYLARVWPDEPRYARAFADRVEKRVRSELDPPRSSQGMSNTIDDGRSYDRLVAEQADEVEQWLAPAIGNGRLDLGHMLFGAHKAVIDLARALLRAGRPSGAAVWRALIASMSETSVKSDDLRLMPFDVPGNAVTGPLRREAMEGLAFDQLLLEAASGLRRLGDTADHLAIIAELLEGPTYDYARALVLAGELDHDAEADALWNARLLPADLPRWLAAVRTRAHRRYERTIQARHWLTAFIDSPDPLVQFAAFELFVRCASRGCARWAGRTMTAARLRIAPRAYDHWRINVPALNALLKDDGKQAKDALAYSRVPKHDQAPWH